MIGIGTFKDERNLISPPVVIGRTQRGSRYIVTKHNSPIFYLITYERYEGFVPPVVSSAQHLVFPAGFRSRQIISHPRPENSFTGPILDCVISVRIHDDTRVDF